MELTQIQLQFNNYKQHILELNDQVYILTTTLSKQGQVHLYQFTINYNTQQILQKKHLNIQFQMALFIQTSMVGYYYGEQGCLIGIHSGKLFHIQNNKIKEFSISGTALMQIELITESLCLIGCESGQINLYDIIQQTSIFIFNEYLSTPLKYFRIRYFYDTIVQGKQDGQLTFFILNDSMKNILAKRDQIIQQKIQSSQLQEYENILISQPNSRLYVSGQKLLDFVLFGDIIITLTQQQIECLLVDLEKQEKIRLKVIQLSINVDSINILNETLILYSDQNVHIMDINNGTPKLILNQKGIYMNLLMYIQDSKIYYK